MLNEKQPGVLMQSEMAEQPGRVAAALEAGAYQATHLNRMMQAAPRSVVLLGRGSSRSAATYGVHALRTLAGKVAYQVSPAELGWAEHPPNLRDALVVAISQSGESREILAAAERAVAQGSSLLVVTNSPSSALARIVDDPRSVLDCRAGRESAVPATKSFTTTLACLLTLALAPAPDALDKAKYRIPLLMQEALENTDARLDLTGLSGFVVTGEGFTESVAEEGAIKLRETLGTIVASLETSEFLHGSVNSVYPGSGVVAIGASSLDNYLAQQALIGANARGATTGYIGPDAFAPVDTYARIPEIPAAWSPFLAILPLQRAAYEAALAVGSNPDTPAGLSKITRIGELKPHG